MYWHQDQPYINPTLPTPHQLQEVLVQEEMEAARLAEEAARREKRARERQEMAAAYQEQVGGLAT